MGAHRQLLLHQLLCPTLTVSCTRRMMVPRESRYIGRGRGVGCVLPTRLSHPCGGEETCRGGPVCLCIGGPVPLGLRGVGRPTCCPQPGLHRSCPDLRGLGGTAFRCLLLLVLIYVFARCYRLDHHYSPLQSLGYHRGTCDKICPCSPVPGPRNAT